MVHVKKWKRYIFYIIGVQLFAFSLLSLKQYYFINEEVVVTASLPIFLFLNFNFISIYLINKLTFSLICLSCKFFLQMYERWNSADFVVYRMLMFVLLNDLCFNFVIKLAQIDNLIGNNSNNQKNILL